MIKDYFPFKVGMQYIYEYASSEFAGLAQAVVTVVSVKNGKKECSANLRMRVELKGHSTSTDYMVRKTARDLVSEDGIVVGGRIEFPLPLAVGRKWEAYPDSSELVSMDETVEVPAGKYKHCLKVVTLLSSGDAGSAVRYYAPDVGYVHEKYNGEDLQAEVSLLSVLSAAPEDMKPPRNNMQPRPDPETPEEEANSLATIAKEELAIAKSKKRKPRKAKAK